MPSVYYYSNQSAHRHLPVEQCQPRKLGPGIFALSNAELDTPWPKLVYGRDKFTAIVEASPQRSENDLIEDLLSLLRYSVVVFFYLKNIYS